ncbi:MAG: hypothetical protein BroJett009_06090 [Armatimonadota bacterium]|nr:MAG: hypothetical protein BroJett009_06090 [Armatimonadota bacterium]
MGDAAAKWDYTGPGPENSHGTHMKPASAKWARAQTRSCTLTRARHRGGRCELNPPAPRARRFGVAHPPKTMKRLPSRAKAHPRQRRFKDGAKGPARSPARALF